MNERRQALIMLNVVVVAAFAVLIVIVVHNPSPYAPGAATAPVMSRGFFHLCCRCHLTFLTASHLLPTASMGSADFPK